MRGPYLISVDMGCSGTKAAVYDADGKLWGEAYQEHPTSSPKPGWIEYNPADFYRATVGTVREVAKKVDPKDIIAIGVDSMMGGWLPVDKEGEPLGPFGLVGEYTPQVEWIKKNHEELVWKTTGNTIGEDFNAPRLLWLKRNKPKIFEKTYKFLYPKDYINVKLTEAEETAFVTDYTILPSTMLYDCKTLNWSQQLCELFNIPEDKLPKVVPPWQIVGELTRKTAEELGLKKGISVIAGSGDAPASWLGAGMVEQGQAVDVAGTFSHFAFCVSEPVPDIRHKTLECWKSALGNLWVSMGVLRGGMVLRWFRDELSESVKKEAENIGSSAYRILDEEAAKIPPGSENLLFIPHLAGRRDPWWPNARGVWFGLRFDHKRGHLYRAILESIAFEYYSFLAVLRGNMPNFECKEARAVGGGAKSRFWCQIKADVLDIPYVGLAREEGASLGTAVTAGYGAGLFKDIPSTIREWVKVTEKIQPRSNFHKFYSKHFKVYNEILNSFRDQYDRLIELAKMTLPTS